MFQDSRDEGEESFADYGEPGDDSHIEYNENGSGDGAGKSFGSSCLICLFGVVLFPLSLFILGYNEKNTVCQDHIMALAEDQAVVGDCDSADSVEGKFAFYSCPIAKEGLQAMGPDSFGLPGLKELVSFNTVAGAQQVEMYQCIEKKEQVKAAPKPTHTEARRRRSELKNVGLIQRRQLQQQQHRLVLEDKDDAALIAHDDIEEQAEKQVVEVVGGAALVRISQERSVVRSEQNQSEPVATAVYKYSMGWSGVYYDSTQFKATPQNIAASGCADFMYNGKVNHNPALPDRGDGNPVELGRQLVRATEVKAGVFTMSDATQMEKFTANAQIDLTPFTSKFSLKGSTDNIVTKIGPDTVSVHPERMYYLSSCKDDRLGCLRISYNASEAEFVSVLGAAGSAGVMAPMSVPPKWGCGAQDFIRMYPEEMTKEQMITQMREENDATTWAFRVVGLVMAWLALYCCFDPIATAADVMGDVLSYIPFFGEFLASMLEGVVTMFLCLISCGIGLSCGLFVIGLVWLGMRPMVGGPIVGAAVVMFLFAFFASRSSERDPKKMRKPQARQCGPDGMPFGANYPQQQAY